MPFMPFATQSVDKTYSQERLVNYIFRPASGISPGVLMGRSRLLPQVDAGNRIRNMIVMAGNIYAVARGTVWKYDIAGATITSVGSVADNQQVSMATSGAELAIVTGGTYYICDGSTTASYSTGAITNPQWVVYDDGYFVVSGTNSGRDDAITVSDLDDGTTFNALNFSFAENAPDEIRAVATLNNQVWLFGSDTVEKWWNSGAGNFPYEPAKSQFLEKGILNGRCWAKIDNTLIWIGDDNIVYRSGGGTPQVISTKEVKEVLDNSVVEDCYAFTDRGAELFAIRREDGTTLIYDVTTGLWPEFSTGIGYNTWLPTCVAKLNGVQYFGTDRGTICKASTTHRTDDGIIVRSEATSQPLVLKDGEYFTIDYINVRTETPDTLVDNAEAQVVLQMSKNGREWGVNRSRNMGGIGDYNKEIKWNALGAFKRAQARFWITDAVSHDIHGMTYGAS